MSADLSDKILTYWLIPAEPALGYFRSVIRDLADRLDAPVFEPHVTLYVTNAVDENPPAVLQSTLANLPLRLFPIGLACSEKFTKTLYLEFQSNAAAQQLSDKLRAASVSQREYELSPHLSLIYKTMAADEKRQIMNSLEIAFTEVEFDSVKALLSPAKIESRADAESWRVVAAAQLTG